VTRPIEYAASADLDRTEAIRRIAYERWDAEGRPEGRDVVHWLEAEQYYLATLVGGATIAGDGKATPITDRPRGFRPRATVPSARKSA